MDDIAVFYAGQACGKIPYTLLPVFRLFCQESGLHFQWEQKQGRILVDQGFKGKICILKCGNRWHSHERNILKLTERFLTNAGISVILSPNDREGPEQGNVSVRLTVEKTDTGDHPRITILQDQNRCNHALVRCLEVELNDAGIPFESEFLYASQPHHSCVEVRCQLPCNMAPSVWKEWEERIAFFLASGILRHLKTELRLSPISCLPPVILQVLAAGVIAQQQQGMPIPVKTSENQALSRLPVQEELAAEVFFDYTVLRSDIVDKPFLIFGNLYVKNTGTEALINPVVCLRVDPPGSVNLGGQILPANMVETLGVQSSAGVKGWRFLEEDWFEQAKERGEYWMAPIQPVRIAPKEVHPFQNFQIAVMTPESGNSVTIEGFVFFREQQVQFSSNNRIALSC